ncbi:MAG: GerMN domain-containing protein [Lachnospiraceae bacterium]|jgi:germination protein M
MKRINILIPLLVLCLLLCACTAQSTQTGSSTADTETESSTYLIYGLDADLSSIVTKDYVPEDGSDPADMQPEDLIPGLLSALATTTPDLSFIYPIRDFSVNSYVFDEDAGSLTIDFDHGYADQNALTEVLARAAIVETMCEVPGVLKVSFSVEGEPLKDSRGNLVGEMTKDGFISSSTNEINSAEKVELTLYFANSAGDQLVPTYRTTYYNTNIALERLITEQLIQGPNIDTVGPTLNPQTKVLSVTTRDGVCYVNLDEAFLTDPYNVTDQVAVYSLVNSLCGLSSVTKVQISVNGSTSYTFMDTLPLSTVFEENDRIVEQEEISAGEADSETSAESTSN